MSNPLSVRRVIVQTIDEQGNPEGQPTYGVMAADGYEQAYCDVYASLNELNEAINQEKSILKIVQGDGQFDTADHNKIGTNNFYGKDWEQDEE